MATARSIDGLQRPAEIAEEFDYGERVYVSVEFIAVREGTVLGFRWECASGCDGSYETPPQQPIRRGFFAFYIDDAGCPGRYTVDITVDGETVAVTEFVIREPASSS